MKRRIWFLMNPKQNRFVPCIHATKSRNYKSDYCPKCGLYRNFFGRERNFLDFYKNAYYLANSSPDTDFFFIHRRPIPSDVRAMDLFPQFSRSVHQKIRSLVVAEDSKLFVSEFYRYTQKKQSPVVIVPRLYDYLYTRLTPETLVHNPPPRFERMVKSYRLFFK